MANYLPVLLVSLNTDDSSVSTLPRAQVDYLSHDWQEEDVWRSWRNMTRRKNEITNGMRLENASWRTWWKQRNKLKTVSPETLNWLKDSDVTWLYGPLHTAVDWTPPPKPKADSTSVGKDNSAHDRLDLSIAKKPILKHRSICDLLTSDLPSPLFSPVDSGQEVVAEPDLDIIEEEEEELDDAPDLGPSIWEGLERPPLKHTKSDTHVFRWGPSRVFRKESPPRVIAETDMDPTPQIHPTPHSYVNVNPSFPPSEQRADDTPPGKKKIKFNTFVEQCISIEKPKKLGDIEEYFSSDGYEEDEETGFLDDGLSAEWSEFPASESESDDDEDALEIQTRSSKLRKSRSRTSSRTNSSSSSGSSSGRRPSSGRQSQFRPPLVRAPTNDKERISIASIAPTMLKTRGDENGVWDDGFGDDAGLSDDGMVKWYAAGGKGGKKRLRDGGGDSKEAPVETVYVPPVGSNYSVKEGAETTDDFDRHPEDVFGTSQKPLKRSSSSGSLASTKITRAPIPYAPMSVVPSAESSGLEGLGLGDDQTRPRRHSRRHTLEDHASPAGSNLPRSRSGLGSSPLATGVYNGHAPEVVVVGDESGDGKSRGREITRTRSKSDSRSVSGSISRSRTPSPVTFSPVPSVMNMPSHSAAVPVPRRGRSSTSSPPLANSLLSPPARGRSMVASPSASDSGSGSRGRSAHRTSSSSLSDRDRSTYAHGSPVGSLSPDRLGSGPSERRGVSGTRTVVERGRGGLNRSLSQSLSPEGGNSSPAAPASSGIARTFAEGRLVTASPDEGSTATASTKDGQETPTPATVSLPLLTHTVDPSNRRSEDGDRPSCSLAPSSPAYHLYPTKSTILPGPSHLASPSTSYSTATSPAIALPTESANHSLVNPPTPTKEHHKHHSRHQQQQQQQQHHTYPSHHHIQHDHDRHSEDRETTDETIVGRIVSSAGAYLGLWHGSGHDKRDA